jgi:CheY-like chemotaxis protein
MTAAAYPIAMLAVDDEPGVPALARRCLHHLRVTLTEAASGR